MEIDFLETTNSASVSPTGQVPMARPPTPARPPTSIAGASASAARPPATPVNPISQTNSADAAWYSFLRTASNARRLSAVTMGYWSPSADANRIARDNQRRRQLAALEFVCRRFDPIEDVIDELGFVSRRDDLFRRSLLLKIKLED